MAADTVWTGTRCIVDGMGHPPAARRRRPNVGAGRDNSAAHRPAIRSSGTIRMLKSKTSATGGCTDARWLHGALVLCLLLCSWRLTAAQQNDLAQNLVPASLDPEKVVGSEACIKCHENEYQVWRDTPHCRTFETLHKNPNAQTICGQIGVRSIKRGDVCIKCHYTEQLINAKPKAVSGVSCESCHGAARDWMAIHNDYGGPTITKAQETPEHRRQRVQESMRLGMRNPANLYLIARSCYNCHTVPNEQLVNVGGHQAGSLDFELVSWSQGMVRHNFLRGNGANLDSDKRRLRVMYLVGLMTDLEFSLRATAQATQVARFGTTSARRAYEMRRRLAQIQQKINHEQLEAVLRQAYAVKLKSRNADQLTTAADLISQAIFLFAETEDGSRLLALEPELPAESAYKR